MHGAAVTSAIMDVLQSRLSSHFSRLEASRVHWNVDGALSWKVYDWITLTRPMSGPSVCTIFLFRRAQAGMRSATQACSETMHAIRCGSTTH